MDGLAFDEDGGLWTPLGGGDFGRLSQTQLSASGSVTPEVVISSTDLRAGHQIALYPAPAATPLFHRLE